MKLPKLETLIVIIFFLCIALWMANKCGSRRSTDYKVRSVDTSEELEERPARRDTVVKYQAPPVTPPASTGQSVQQGNEPMPTPSANAPKPGAIPVPKPGATATTTVAPKPAAATTTAASKPAAKSATTLFVTIDGLKMRKQPGLKGDLVASLKLFDEVEFLNQRTDWTQEISLGYEKVTDRWVKVRTKGGKEGWVFGAGVNYYKEKRKGVME